MDGWGFERWYKVAVRGLGGQASDDEDSEDLSGDEYLMEASSTGESVDTDRAVVERATEMPFMEV